jgi:anti-sigma regulatory factor (Ser/Thr protein kinase)
VRAAATFQSRLPVFPEVRAWAEGFGAAVDADRSVVLRLVLVLEELFANTVAHGYAGREDGPIWVTLASRPDSIEVIYEDAGPAFDPFTAAPDARSRPAAAEGPTGGLGIALVRGLSASARYARIDGRNCITLALAFDDPRLTPPAATG